MIPPAPQHTIVVTTFDEPEKTDRCVRKLLASGEGFRILVVDHGHDDWISPSDGRVEVIKESPELWWAGACNRGIEDALAEGSPAVMLMNPDCILAGHDAETLFAISERSHSLVAPIQLDMETGAVLCAGAVPLLSLGFPTLFERKETGGPLDRRTIICGGRGVVIPRQVFAEVGTLAAADLPHYWADHDFFLRCRRRGFDMRTTTEIAVKVDQSRTSTAATTADLTRLGLRSSLTDPRSHRNTASVGAFFRRNYPISLLHGVGTVLYRIRYLVSWAVQRAGRLLLRRSAP